MLLKKYTPTWITDFESIKNELDSALNDLKYTIEHVGSTAVPHLDAKPIIDIDVTYSSDGEFEKIKLGLEKAGYYHNGNQGIEDREVFKRNGIIRSEVLDTITHHLYVCPIESKALERHILTRNYLRKHDWAREKYQQMKYGLAELADQDKKVYAALKEVHINEFIDFMVEATNQR